MIKNGSNYKVTYATSRARLLTYKIYFCWLESLCCRWMYHIHRLSSFPPVRYHSSALAEGQAVGVGCHCPDFAPSYSALATTEAGAVAARAEAGKRLFIATWTQTIFLSRLPSRLLVPLVPAQWSFWGSWAAA